MNVKKINSLLSKHNFFIGLFIVVFFSGIFALFLCNKTLPTAEGWYSYYAKEILDGKIVYVDFEYLFTPAYMYIVAGIIKIFGFNLIVLRIWGVIIFVGLGILIYNILCRCFSVTASAISSLVGVFYLQSEVYSVFYDYVRVMDIFSLFATLFLVLTIESWLQNPKKTYNLYLWGLFSSLFFLVKQNMGGLYIVFSILLLIFSCFYLKFSVRQSMLVFCKYTVSVLVPIAIFSVICLKLGIFHNMIQSVFFNALDAKGGLVAVLFQWIINGYESFAKVFLWGVLFVLFVFVMQKASLKYFVPSNKSNILLILYSIILFPSLLSIFYSEKVGVYFSQQRRLDVTIPFMTTVCMMVVLGIKLIYDILKKNTVDKHQLIILSLLGTCFTFSYGAGMSGGLSLGESSLCVALVLCILFDSMNFKGDFIPKFCLSIYCIFLILSCIGYKLVYPCYWWGMNESSIYESTQKSSIPVLDHIRLSKSTKEMYEGIVNVVQERTEPEDSIYCFPHIPVFYLLCDRDDPGVFSKVQWFDVSSTGNLENDINVLNETHPSAIIIYNLYGDTYKGHEKLFNSNKESGTRETRDALYELVNTENYEYAGTYISEDNNISVYILDKDKISENDLFEKGSGTKESPYLISSEDELINLAMKVNQGYSFEDVYFKQTTSLDLSDIIWVPAGYNENTTFKGNYNKNGYSIKNVNSGPKNSNVPFGKKIFK